MGFCLCEIFYVSNDSSFISENLNLNYKLYMYMYMNFQMVDMRWGVTNEAQNDHMTSACCLKEIRNCINVSAGPNFVVSLKEL